jgi:hypothetical protein
MKFDQTAVFLRFIMRHEVVNTIPVENYVYSTEKREHVLQE